MYLVVLIVLLKERFLDMVGDYKALGEPGSELLDRCQRRWLFHVACVACLLKSHDHEDGMKSKAPGCECSLYGFIAGGYQLAEQSVLCERCWSDQKIN